MLLTLPAQLSMTRLLGREDRVLSARPRVTRWQAFGVPAGRTLPLPEARGHLVVHCREGMVWITHDGDPRDIVLRPRESYRVNGYGRLTAHAMRGDCALELQVDV